jgi:hypothetical protein
MKSPEEYISKAQISETGVFIRDIELLLEVAIFLEKTDILMSRKSNFTIIIFRIS